MLAPQLTGKAFTGLEVDRAGDYRALKGAILRWYDITGGATTGRERLQRSEKDLTCFNCGRKGHIFTKCPRNAMFCGEGQRLRQMEGSNQPPGKMQRKCGTACSGLVEGKRVGDILLDTGCSKTLVRRELVPEEKVVEGEVVTIRCAHGDIVLYPVAEVEMDVKGVRIRVEAAVSDTLPMSVLLGTDVPELGDLLGSGTQKRWSRRGDAMMVTTRSHAGRQEIEEVVQQQREKDSGVRAKPVAVSKEDKTETEADGEDQDAEGVSQETNSDFTWRSEFADDLFMAGREKMKQTRGQKRADRQQYAQESRPDPAHELDMSTDGLRKMQDADMTLVAVRRAAGGEPDTTAGGGFFKQEGLIYRRWTPPGRNGEEMAVGQLVLPLPCRQTVLQLAHSILHPYRESVQKELREMLDSGIIEPSPD